MKISSIQSLSRVLLFMTPWIAACQASLSITDSQGLPELMSIESMMPSNHLIFCCPLLLLWKCCTQFSSIQSLSHVWLFATPWTTARQASLSITNSQSPPEPMSIELVMPSNYLIFCHPLLLLPSIFPSIRVFQMSQLFTWGGQIIGVSASTSVLPMKTQDWSPLEWTGWISLQSKGLDFQESSPTPQLKSINSSVLSFLHSPTSSLDAYSLPMLTASNQAIHEVFLHVCVPSMCTVYEK